MNGNMKCKAVCEDCFTPNGKCYSGTSLINHTGGTHQLFGVSYTVDGGGATDSFGIGQGVTRTVSFSQPVQADLRVWSLQDGSPMEAVRFTPYPDAYIDLHPRHEADVVLGNPWVRIRGNNVDTENLDETTLGYTALSNLSLLGELGNGSRAVRAVEVSITVKYDEYVSCCDGIVTTKYSNDGGVTLVDTLPSNVAECNDLQVLSTTESNGVTTEITISNGNTVPINHPDSSCNCALNIVREPCIKIAAHGRIAPNGNVIYASGAIVTRLAAGRYRITHNLDDLRYTVSGTAVEDLTNRDSGYLQTIEGTHQGNSVEVYIATGDNSANPDNLVDREFYFQVFAEGECITDVSISDGGGGNPPQSLNCAGGSVSANVGSTISINNCSVAQAISDTIGTASPNPEIVLEFSGGTIPTTFTVTIPVDNLVSANYGGNPFTTANIVYTNPNETPTPVNYTFDTVTMTVS